jgi:hypothetical protein
MTVWITIAAVAVVCAAAKVAGPMLLGDRELPVWAHATILLLAPALVSALVVVQTVGEPGRLVLDARLVGVGVGGIALLARAPMLVAVLAAATATAVLRAIT